MKKNKLLNCGWMVYFLFFVILNSIICIPKVFSETNTFPSTFKVPIVQYQTDEPISRFAKEKGLIGTLDAGNYPADPISDIVWSAGTSGVSDIQEAFNAARQAENSQLGISIPMLTLPSQSEWDMKSDGEKALWLINRERIDRGIEPLHGLEENITSVAQSYAQYLIDNDAWGHDADGYSPWERLDLNEAINACQDFLNVAENLAVFMTTGSSIPLPIERSVFNWMYDDGDCCTWGHRHAILWYPYNDNSGTSGMEGFLGIGRASGPYTEWNFAEMIVMNVFDPCSNWNYEASSPLKWVTSKEEAVSAALSQGKYILLMAGRYTCGLTSYMRLTVCETNDPPIKTVISENYVPWFCDIDNSTEYYPYETGLGSFYLPLICRIDPRNPDVYLDRSTNIQEIEPFYARLLDGIGDLDSDGMPDEWERQYNLNALIDDAQDDDDGDGWNNITEYLKGTIPNDAGSHPPKAMPWLPLLLSED